MTNHDASSQTAFSEQQQQEYKRYKQLCHACCAPVTCKVNLDEIKRLVNEGVPLKQPRWKEKYFSVLECLMYSYSYEQINFEEFKLIFNFLEKAGVNPSSPEGLEGNLLIKAIRAGHVDIADWLLDKKGFEVNSRDFAKDTPLHAAVLSRHGKEKEFIECLKKYRASLHMKNSSSETPFEVAKRINKLTLLPLLKTLEPKQSITMQQAWKAREKAGFWMSLITLFSNTNQLNNTQEKIIKRSKLFNN